LFLIAQSVAGFVEFVGDYGALWERKGERIGEILVFGRELGARGQWVEGREG
jgi:hypothetical protein